MPLGSSIFLIAAGAILRYAVTAHISGVSRPTLGLILMLVGAAGVLLSLLYMASARRRVAVRDPYREPR
jgi:multisubunit Na+/H+ antiporter MnhB subunit